MAFGWTQREKDYALYRALEYRGNVENIRRALKKGADPNMNSYTGKPPLYSALGIYTESTALAAVNMLLEKGAKVDLAKDNTPPLHYLLRHNQNHSSVAKRLIEAGADALEESCGRTPIFSAIERAGWPSVKVLMDHKGHEKMVDAGGQTLLMAAVTHQAPFDILDRIMEMPVDVNARTRDLLPALHTAVALGVPRSRDDYPSGVDGKEYVAWLLKQPGIDANIRDDDGRTPLLAAVHYGRAEIAQQLIAAGADVNAAGKEGDTPLAAAVRAGNLEIAEALIAAGAAPDAPGSNGERPVTLAARNGSIPLVTAVLAAAEKAGVKPDLQPAVFAAAEKGQPRVLEILFNAGADPAVSDSDGRTPLIRAALNDQVEAMSVIIKAGAQPDAADSHGMQAYDHAVSAGKTKAKEYLSRFRTGGHARARDNAAAPDAADGCQYTRINDHSLEVQEGGGLSMTFNFWTQQVIFRDIERPAPVTVQNFSEVQRQEAISEAYAKLKELGGNPPEPGTVSILKKSPGLTAKP